MDDKIMLGGHTYAFYTMPPTEAFPLLFTFFKTFGAPIATLITRENTPDDAVIAALVAALGQGESKCVLDLFKTVFTYVRQDGRTIALDEHFSGKNKELLHVFFYALVFNFADFLGENLLTFALSALAPSKPSPALT